MIGILIVEGELTAVVDLGVPIGGLLDQSVVERVRLIDCDRNLNVWSRDATDAPFEICFHLFCGWKEGFIFGGYDGHKRDNLDFC